MISVWVLKQFIRKLQKAFNVDAEFDAPPKQPAELAEPEPAGRNKLSEEEVRRLPEKVGLNQAARALGCTRRNIDDRIARGTLTASGRGTHKYILRQAIWDELGVVPTPPKSPDE